MTLGLPDHLVEPVLSRALSRASHWFALTCLLGAVVSALALGVSFRSSGLWIAVLAVLAMAGVLVALSLRHTVLLTVVYLVVGGGGTYLYTVAVLGLPGIFPASNIFLIALPKLALIMVGGAGASALTGVLWSTAGFVLAESVTVLGAVHTEVAYLPDVFTVSAYLFLVAVLLLAGSTRRPHGAAQSAIHRAVQAEQSMLLRQDLEQRALELNQDTTLNELVALSRAHAGPLSDNLAGSLRAALLTLRGTDWLADADARSVGRPPGVDAWLGSEVYAAVERCRDRGLVVDVTGDRSALGRLDAGTDRELGLAVQQCLINVILHAGIVSAEVDIGADDATISVMVMDAGRGFTEAEAGADRLGLRQAVRRRIERLGGSVTVLTRPDAGTSVLLSVPAADTAPVIDPSVIDPSVIELVEIPAADPSVIDPSVIDPSVIELVEIPAADPATAPARDGQAPR
ncbi:ATP-binding protein [Cryobacterium sp. PH31-AA6]|uniref:sensor histidine kinase n=1 Tax=Cryobacterium sp. PH31-AA6 TaxID=3046205 RepID=UPI0024B99FBD|nr:ATP-binding protein [Cryobacterium sp. PH31-AA6]MDJ0323911.1 ATP-binding protein [Cryobacterium sp. PH31-AA6]